MASGQLMSEEDVREYFLQNNGIVRNTDIVTYFRPYLSDPSIRDEARVLFKSYVNKLANVKTENGEKFLVLKRQYFHPIDGNGNGRPVAATTVAAAGLQNYGSPTQISSYMNPPSYPPPNPYAGGYPPPVARNDPMSRNSMSRPNLQRSLSQQSHSMSQSNLYGSAFSLSGMSNYGELYQVTYTSSSSYSNPMAPSNNNYSNAIGSVMNSNYQNPMGPAGGTNFGNQIGPPSNSLLMGSVSNSNLYSNPLPGGANSYSNPGGPYPSNLNVPPPYSAPPPPQPPTMPAYSEDYGLPPIPSNPLAPPRRYPTSPPSSSSLPSNSSNTSPLRVPPPYRPPPYRPPPPGPRLPVSPPSSQTGMRFPAHFSHSSNQSEPPTPTGNPVPQQYQRSLSVPGVVPSAIEGLPNSESALGTPPPPVPPRSKRGGFERGSRQMMMMGDPDEGEAGFENFSTIRSERSNSIGADLGQQHQQTQQHGAIPELRRANSEGAALGDGNNNGSSSSGSTAMDENKENNMDLANGLTNDVEQKISVKERLQKFNRIASESELGSTSPTKMPSSSSASSSSASAAAAAAAARSRRENNNNGNSNHNHKHDSVDFDTASLSSFGFGFAHMQPKDKEWILKAANCDYHALNKMAQENPSLVKRRDMNGYTALHWAAKHGNAELVKLLAGTYKSDINCKSNGGYTPLHLAAQFGRQDVYDILVQVYNADPNIRDHSGKKPMQYLVRQDTTVSMDTFKKLKEKRRINEQSRESFLRIGSLNVRVKKTTEAFGNFLTKSNSSAASIERILHKSWGSADNLPEADGSDKDKQMMPPPSSGNAIRRVTSKVNGKRRARRSAPASDSPTIKESQTDSDSDTACGFGSEWKNTTLD